MEVIFVKTRVLTAIISASWGFVIFIWWLAVKNGAGGNRTARGGLCTAHRPEDTPCLLIIDECDGKLGIVHTGLQSCKLWTSYSEAAFQSVFSH